MYLEFAKGEKHKNGKNPEISDDINAFSDCGYILEDDDLVVDIDCLQKDKIRKMLDFFNINTQVVWTNRGAHLYFQKPRGFNRAKGVIPLGFFVEFKHSKNTEAVTIKQNGRAREIENEGVRERLPEYLNLKRRSRFQELLGFGDNSGRNNALYEHKKKIGYLREYKKVLRFINLYIFDEPLTDKEFESVSREEDLAGQKDQETLTAEIIAREHKIVKYRGNLYYFDDDKYQSNEDGLKNLVSSYCPEMKSAYWKEVIEQFKYKSELIPDNKEFEIQLDNGILADGEFIECDFQGFTPYRINIDYDPNAEPVKEVDDYLKQLTDDDPEYIELIKEILGHILITNREFKRMLAKFFIFVGDGGNGKGTLLQVIKNIYGFENCSALSIKEMSNESYAYQMIGKLVNLGDDIHDEPINNDQMKVLKNITTCDTMEARKMYENSRTVEMSISLLFTSNHQIKSFEKGDSYTRRVMWLPMYSKPKKKDPMFIAKLTTKQARRYWIRLAIEGYLRLYQNHFFTVSKKVFEYNEEYHRENDSTLQFIEDLHDSQIQKQKPKDLYEQYKLWAEDNSLSVLSQKTLVSNIEKLRGFERKSNNVNGKTVYSFYKSGVKTEEELNKEAV